MNRYRTVINTTYNSSLSRFFVKTRLFTYFLTGLRKEMTFSSSSNEHNKFSFVFQFVAAITISGATVCVRYTCAHPNKHDCFANRERSRNKTNKRTNNAVRGAFSKERGCIHIGGLYFMYYFAVAREKKNKKYNNNEKAHIRSEIIRITLLVTVKGPEIHPQS